MEVGSISNYTGISGQGSIQKEFSKETFLLLLTTQLQHQDPLEPTDDVEFIEQMATFASLEQQQLTNENLGVMQLYENSINNSNALGIVGKDVKLTDNVLAHKTEGQVHNFQYLSDSEAAKLTITIHDEDGEPIFTHTEIGVPDGEQNFTWHGRDDLGRPLPPGDYRVSVTLENDDGDQFSSVVFQRKPVHGVSYENNTIMVLVGDQRIPIENVVEVYEPAVDTGADPETEGSILDDPAFLSGYQQLENVAAKQAVARQAYQPHRPFTVIPGGK